MGTSETHAAVTNGSPPCGGSVAKIFCGSRSTFVDQEMGRLRIVPGVPRTSATTPRQEGQYDVVAMCLPCREQLWFTGGPLGVLKRVVLDLPFSDELSNLPADSIGPLSRTRGPLTQPIINEARFFVLGHSSVENPAPNMQRQRSANTSLLPACLTLGTQP